LVAARSRQVQPFSQHSERHLLLCAKHLLICATRAGSIGHRTQRLSDPTKPERRVVGAKKSRSGAILEFYRRAAEARRMADVATNPLAKADFLAIEQHWLSLARSYEAETVRAAPRRAPRSPHK